MRIFDTPDLFGIGVGTGSYGDTKCEFCGALYNKGEDARGVYDGDSVLHTSFAGKEICICCFEKIENEILARMPDILTWYRKILDLQKERIADLDRQLKGLGQ